MKQANFYSFAFAEYRREKYQHTDNREGAPYHYLAVLEEGNCRIVSDGVTLELGPGDAFYIPMDLPYQSYWTGRHIRFLSFGFRYFPESARGGFLLQRLPDYAADRLRAIPTVGNPGSRELGQLYQVLGALIPDMKENIDADHKLLQQAKRYMDQNYEYTATDVARHCCIGQSTLYALFRRHEGITPNQYKQKVMVERAVRLLRTTNRSVQDISDSVGFSSPSYFRKLLRKYTGDTPCQMRKTGISL